MECDTIDESSGVIEVNFSDMSSASSDSDHEGHESANVTAAKTSAGEARQKCPADGSRRRHSKHKHIKWNTLSLEEKKQKMLSWKALSPEEKADRRLQRQAIREKKKYQKKLKRAMMKVGLMRAADAKEADTTDNTRSDLK